MITRMRIYSSLGITLLCVQAAFAQNYTIQTVAGGGFPNAIPATSASLGEVDGVAVDAAGNIYIANGTYSVVTMVDASGNLTAIAGNGKAGFSGDNGPAVNAQLNGAQGVAVDASGNIYIADTFNHRIRKISAGTITTVAGNGVSGYSGDGGPATNAQLSYPWAVALDSSGNLYIADANNHVIRKVSGGTITTFAGTGVSGAGGNNISPTSGALNSPQGVAVDTAGAVYLSDTGNAAVRKVSGGVMTILAAPSSFAAFGGNNPVPQGLALDSSGNVYIADSSENAIWKIAGTTLSLFAGTGNTGFGGDGGSAASALFNTPAAIAVDSSGRVLIADSLNGRIRRIAGGTISTVAGLGTGGFVGDNGPAVGSQLFGPGGVAVDGAGTVYIADSSNARIRAVANGTISTLAGNGTAGDSGDGGAAANANFVFPTGVAVDASGTVYAADFDANRIRKISGGIVNAFAGNGTAGVSNDGTPAASAALVFSPSLAVDSSGNVYFSENGGFVSNVRVGSRVRKVSGGTLSTVAGVSGTAGYSGDGGAATSAQLNGPNGVTVDASGNVYVADTHNNRVRMISGGTISTIAGNGAAGSAGDGGPATGAQLNLPQGVAVDSSGNVYIADTGNHRVRVVSNGVITTIAGTGTAGYSGDGGAGIDAKLNSPEDVAVDQFGRVIIADTANNAIRVLTLPCSYTVAQAPISAPSSGGQFGVAIQTTAICSWTVTGLPSWITVSGASSGTGNATVNLQVAANTGVARNATVTVAGAQVTVNQAAGCIYTLSTGGQTFPAAGGTGSVMINVNPGCTWSASGPPSWITITSGASGSGNGTVNFTAAANIGASRTGSMTVAGTSFSQGFSFEQSAAAIAGLTLGGSLAQVASQGTWDFTLNAINLGASGALTRFSFFDNNGAGLALPLTFPQQSAGNGPLLASVLDRSINANAQLVIQSTGPDAAQQLIGSGLLQSNGNVSGFGIFSNPTFGWNAVVPLETRNAASYILAFDNTGTLVTGVALANLAATAANVNVIIRDDTGVQIGTFTIPLSAQGHLSFLLNQPPAGFPSTLGKRGTLEFDTPGFGAPGAGQISVLGLRANGGALTTLPVLASGDTPGGAIAQTTYNGGFTSVFYIVNTGSTSADFTLSFIDESGNPLQAPLLLPQSGTKVTTSALTRTLAAGAMLVVETVADDTAVSVAGSAKLTTTGNISGFEIFKWTTFGQEASVPLETRSPNSFLLVFDDTNATTTGVAIASGAAAAQNVTVNIRNDAGALLKSDQVSLPPNGHTSFLLPAFDAVTTGIRGSAEFVVPTGGEISVIGLRAKADGTLTTIPALVK